MDMLDTKDLFVFPLVSNKAKNLAIAARRSIAQLFWMVDSTGKGDMHHIVFDKNPHMFIPSWSAEVEVEEVRQTEKFEEWKVNGQTIPMWRIENAGHGCAWYTGNRDKQHYELLDMLSEHIVKVFQCQRFELFTELPSVSEDLFVFKHTRRFAKITLSDYLWFNGNTTALAAESLKFVLEKLEIQESLKVEREVPGWFQWTGPLKMKKLIVRKAAWLSSEALMNNECEELDLQDHVFSSAQLNIFLKKWIDGGFPNLEYCSFDATDELSRARVLQGITTTPRPANRPKRHPRFCYGLSYGVDIHRNDGVLATICVHRTLLAMGVWNNL